MAIHVFGIRHHGPGSARSLLASLHALKPEVVLIEGPPEAELLLPLLSHEELKPPIALLLYATDEPSLASFYPQAVFSPEWQAIQFAAKQKLPVRFIDLPQAINFSYTKDLLEKAKAKLEAASATQEAPENVESDAAEDESRPEPPPQEDTGQADND